MASSINELLNSQIDRALVMLLLEYIMGLMGPLVLGLIRDKGRLLRGQVSLAWKVNLSI